MRRIIVLFICVTLLLAACSQKQATDTTIPPAFIAPETQIATEEIPVPEETVPVVQDEHIELLSVSVPAITESFTTEDGTEIFSCTAQHMQLIHPDEELADKVILDFTNRVEAVQSEAQRIYASAQADYTGSENWYPYFYQIIYSPMRIDHGVLSLFGTQNSYSGAQHGSLSCVAANYDLNTGDVLTLGSIMHMDATTDDFISLLIPKLDAMADDLGLFDGYEDGVRSRLSGDENLYEDFFFTNTGLSFFFAPYEIAPYASGVITVEIPYEELPGLIYDGYFPAERELVEGTLCTGAFMETDMEQFQNMAEVVLATGEEIMVVYPDGIVEDVRITIAGDDKNMPEYTVFAAQKMSGANAVVLSLPKDLANRVMIHHTVDEQVESLPLA